MEGLQYVVGIANAALQGRLVERIAVPDDEVVNLYYQWDMNGILDIRLLNPDQEPPKVAKVAGQWWRCLAFRKGSSLRFTAGVSLCFYLQYPALHARFLKGRTLYTEKLFLDFWQEALLFESMS